MGRAPKILGAQMVNTNQGVDPNIARQFQTPFNANQLQGGGNAFNLGGGRLAYQDCIQQRALVVSTHVIIVTKHSRSEPTKGCGCRVSLSVCHLTELLFYAGIAGLQGNFNLQNTLQGARCAPTLKRKARRFMICCLLGNRTSG